MQEALGVLRDLLSPGPLAYVVNDNYIDAQNAGGSHGKMIGVTHRKMKHLAGHFKYTNWRPVST